MGTYAIFNYQFGKIAQQANEKEIEGMESVIMTADEAFPRKQEIFSDILSRDFNKACENDIIHYKNKVYSKEYIHLHLIPPTDDIVIMRIANRKKQTITDANLKESHVEDYPNCIVMIDNRQGIQRLLIENKKTAFRDVKQLAGILQYTFNKLLRRYSLAISLDHLQDSKAFWQYAEDVRTYPDGFYKVCFHLPYPNLERLQKVYSRLTSQIRQSFDSSLNMEFKNANGQVRLDKKDPLQSEIIKSFMEDAGGDIVLYSNSAKRTPIRVGKDSYRAITISDTTITRLTEDAVNNDLFGSAALDNIKSKLKTGIDLENEDSNT